MLKKICMCNLELDKLHSEMNVYMFFKMDILLVSLIFPI